MKTIFTLIALASFSFAASANPPAAPPATPAGHPVAGQTGMGKSDVPLTRKGKVLSSVEAKGFTYIEVQEGGKKIWVAAPTIAVKNGNLISFADATVQAKYHSPSLNRDFNNILFTTRVVIEK